MNIETLILVGWSSLALFVGWAFLAAFVVANMKYRDKKLWHGWLIRNRNAFSGSYVYLPESTCAYWRMLVISPLVMLITYLPIGVVGVVGWVVLILWRLFRGWLLYPLFKGEYADLVDYGVPFPSTKSGRAMHMMANLFDPCVDDHSWNKKVIPCTETVKPIWWVLILILLYETVHHADDINIIVAPAISNAFMYLAPFFLVLIGSITGVIVLVWTIWKYSDKFLKTYELLREKVCRRIPAKEEVLNEIRE